jgi:hypothetical protein
MSPTITIDRLASRRATAVGILTFVQSVGGSTALARDRSRRRREMQRGHGAP